MFESAPLTLAAASLAGVFAAQKRRLHLVIRSVGLDRATTRIALADLVYNLKRLAWIEGRLAPA